MPRPTRRGSTCSSTRSARERRGRSSRESSRFRRAITFACADGRIELRKYWDLDFPDAGDERRLDDPTPLIDELEVLMRQSVERRLRGDVPVVSYISGGLDSTVVLGLSSRERGYAVPSFTIGLDRAGPDERSHAAESAAALGSELVTVTMNRGDIVAAYPELIRAAEGPVMDSSAACLMRLARAVHSNGYKVVLTGEGADEALAGYAWFKTEKIRNMLSVGPVLSLLKGARSLTLASIGGGSAASARLCSGSRERAPPSRTSTISWARPARSFTRHDMWRLARGPLGLRRPGSPERPLRTLAPAEPVALRRVQGDAGRSVAFGQGRSRGDELVGRDALSAAGRRRDLVLRVDRSGIQAARLDRQMAAPPGGGAHAPVADRQPAQDDVPRQPVRGFLEQDRPAWIDQLLSPESLRATGWFDPAAVARERAAQMRFPRITPKRIIMDLSLTCVIATQLWHHLFLGGGLCELPTWERRVVGTDSTSPPGVLNEPFPTGRPSYSAAARRPG